MTLSVIFAHKKSPLRGSSSAYAGSQIKVLMGTCLRQPVRLLLGGLKLCWIHMRLLQ